VTTAFLTSQQLITLACNTAKCPGYATPVGSSLAGALLNTILEEMYSTYDFQACESIYNFTFNSSAGRGNGPYPMPVGYLRASPDEVFYTIYNQPYKLVFVDQSTYDMFNKDPGLAAYPSCFTTDPSFSPTNMYFWPAPSGSYPCTVRYFGAVAPITNPETSSVIPWFPSSMYLLTRLTGELMQLTSDRRAVEYLGDGTDQRPGRAARLLKNVLEMKDDPENDVQKVKLDERMFRNVKVSDLPNTKLVGF